VSGQHTDEPVTLVHLVRHGLVHNPDGILYGRLPSFHLSALGAQMAQRLAEVFADHPVAHLRTSPLERARETVAPMAAKLGLDPVVDDRLIEADSVFEGTRVGVGDGVLRTPWAWKYLANPVRPSWGEPYTEIATRMMGAIGAARVVARGREAVLVSHQLPVWVARCYLEHRRLWHDPRHRECAVASVTTVRFVGDRADGITYREPAADLVARAKDGRNQPAAGA